MSPERFMCLYRYFFNACFGTAALLGKNAQIMSYWGILHVTICLLVMEPDFESITQMQVMNNYVNEIGTKAVGVQKQIEKEQS